MGNSLNACCWTGAKKTKHLFHTFAEEALGISCLEEGLGDNQPGPVGRPQQGDLAARLPAVCIKNYGKAAIKRNYGKAIIKREMKFDSHEHCPGQRPSTHCLKVFTIVVCLVLQIIK